MPTYTVTGTTDPFIQAKLLQGETIIAERDAMAAMTGTVDIVAKARGGFLSSLVRSATTGESFYLQEITANRGAGTVMLAPRYPGEVRVVSLTNESWMLSDGTFLAADPSLTLETSRNSSWGAALVGNTGGFFMLKISGTGAMIISSVGAIHELIIRPSEELIVDSGHAIAWPAHLEMRASLSTNQNAGFLGKVVGAAKSGEGVVLRFSGGSTGGRILVSSRSRKSLIDWIGSFLPGK